VEKGLVFDRVAAEYDRVRPGYPPELIEAALAGGEIRRVLEIGCGTGQLTQALAARGLEVEAVEPGANLAALARRRVPALRVHPGRFEDVELPLGTYDAVFSATAFHWIDPDVGWTKAAAVLRPGGRLALLGYVYVHDDDVAAAHEGLRDAYGADWAFMDETAIRRAVGAHRGNVSEVWAALTSAGARREAAKLFGDTRVELRRADREVDAETLVALQRTTSAHLTLPAERVAEVEEKLARLVESLGGRYPVRQLAILALAERRSPP
jgi:SAM-dependent methyltransferase